MSGGGREERKGGRERGNRMGGEKAGKGRMRVRSEKKDSR